MYNICNEHLQSAKILQERLQSYTSTGTLVKNRNSHEVSSVILLYPRTEAKFFKRLVPFLTLEFQQISASVGGKVTSWQFHYYPPTQLSFANLTDKWASLRDSIPVAFVLN